ncbi:3-oxoacyl-[acyl-carrier-protein] synthase III C-terminal domain-containing protein [Streptosporangium sp. G11]|uniref:3-oxoacyl-[acyl-carrier-protein] synthase III C-terminal domain-containing protein n=1 Tax=Streptosporangium sp. G11 TaxID=3436926 RepID=UPI003EB770D3
MYRSVIDSVGVALPAGSLSTREVVEGCAHPLKLPLETLTGIATRRIAAEGEYAVDLAERAARDCFERSSLGPGDIDLLINGSISRKDGPLRVSYEPSAAAQLRHRLGCARAWAFDIVNACAGNFTAIRIADAMIRAGQIGSALVVCGESISDLIRTAQKEITSDTDPRIACLTLGDAGSAVLLTRSDDERAGFEHIGIRTIGEHHALCVAGPTDASHGGMIMKTEMLALAVIMVREAVAHTHRTLGRMGLHYRDIDLVIPHQTSSTTIEAAGRHMNKVFGGPFLHENNVINNLADLGNTSTTTHVLALRDGVRAERIRPGARVLFGIAGSGISVGTAVYRLDDLPARLASGTRSTRTAPRTTGRGPWSRPVEVAGLGIAHPGASEATSTLELIARASARCLRAADRRPSDVAMLINGGLYRSGMIAEPAVAAIAAGELGFDGATTASGDMLAFDLGNGGLGLFDACRVASALIRCGEVENVLVVASEVEEREPGTSHPGIAACGSALFLRADPERRRGFLGFHTHHLSDRVGSFAAWATQGDGRAFIRSDDRSILDEQCLEHLPRVVAELLDEMSVTPESIRALVPPSLSPASAERLRRRWPVLGKRLVALPGGDLFTSAIPVGLRRLRDEKGAAPGDLVVLTGIAGGGQIGAALYRF